MQIYWCCCDSNRSNSIFLFQFSIIFFLQRKMSNYRIIFLTLVAATILCHSHTYAGPVRSLASVVAARSTQSKIPRSIRTPFRNTEMMTARGFGKRSQQFKDGKVSNNFNTRHKINCFNSSDLDKPWGFNKHETAFADDSFLNDAFDLNGQISDR